MNTKIYNYSIVVLIVCSVDISCKKKSFLSTTQKILGAWETEQIIQDGKDLTSIYISDSLYGIIRFHYDKRLDGLYFASMQTKKSHSTFEGHINYIGYFDVSKKKKLEINHLSTPYPFYPFCLPEHIKVTWNINHLTFKKMNLSSTIQGRNYFVKLKKKYKDEE